MKRINPLEKSTETAMPSAWNNEQQGVCPVCLHEAGDALPMQIVRIGTNPVYVCEAHHVCLPVEDSNSVYDL